jgi:DNA-binding MurR/RpiR family transcriptional regulator
MKEYSAKLPRKGQQAIAALIEAPTIREAASIAGVGEATLFRWLQDTSFQNAYRDAKHRIVNHSITRLQQATGEAVETLVEIMKDEAKPASSRVACAKAILDMSVKTVELEDLVARIEALEELVIRGGRNHDYTKSN